MESSKWLATVASIWIQCSCGASYAFGIYSPVLKSSQGYDQSTLDTVSVFKDIGANAGIISGLLYSAIAANPSRSSSSWFRRGPWMVLLGGAVQCFVGYLFMWLSVTGKIDRPGVWLMCVFMYVAAHGQTFFNTTNVVTAVHNFPQYNGTAVGIMKGFLGLSGAILVQVYYTLFSGKPSTFLLMLALIPSSLSLLLMFFVRIQDIQTRDDKNHLNNFSLLSLIIASYLMFLIILENIITLPQLAQVLSLVFLLFLISSPLGVAIKAQKADSWKLSRKESSLSTTPLLKNDPETVNVTENYPVDENRDSASSSDLSTLEANDMNVIQCLRTIDFWLLFIATMCGMGSGMATINNISQIGESLGYTSTETSALVSLWSIWNYLGRFVAGFISDFFLHKQGWPRPLFICLTLATMSAGHIIIALGFRGNLYIGSVLVGISYGSQWSLMPTITSEIFGVKHMGTIYNTIAVASPVGSYMLSVNIIGGLYDKQVSGEGNACYGAHCFMLAFLILASVTFCGFLVALVLFFKTKRFYTQVLPARRLRRVANH